MGQVSAQCYRVLFLCTGNSARSILAEALLNHYGKGHFVGLSAGSQPTGTVNPHAVSVLRRRGIPLGKVRSKSWDEFLENSESIDFVFTVCANAAGEACPVWPGGPMTAHWGIPDPAALEGTETQKRLAFTTAFESLERRIKAFVNLPIAEGAGGN